MASRAKYVNIADGVSKTEALELGRRLAVDFERIPLGEWQMGIAHEREHNEVLKGDPLKTAMTALDHLKEHPDYYSRLKKMEKGAAAMVEEKPYPGSPEHKKMMMRDAGRKAGMKKAAVLMDSGIAFGMPRTMVSDARSRSMISEELHDPRLYSNLRGLLRGESRKERIRAHRKLKPGTRDSMLQAFREGFRR